MCTSLWRFVHDAVRSSQLESLARSIRIDSFNSAVPGVSSLLDSFALGAPTASTEVRVSEADVQRLSAVAVAYSDKAVSDEQPTESAVARQTSPAELKGKATSQSLGADSFATQLRRNAIGFRPRVTSSADNLASTTQARG